MKRNSIIIPLILSYYHHQLCRLRDFKTNYHKLVSVKLEIIAKLKKLSLVDLEEVNQKLVEIDAEVSKGIPKISRSKKEDLVLLRSKVAQELLHKQELQSQSLSAHKVTPRTPGTPGEGTLHEEKEGYLSDPGSRSSQVQTQAPLHQVDQQSLDDILSRVESLEQRYSLKISALELRCSELEKTVKELKKENGEKASYINELEKAMESHQETTLQNQKDHLDMKKRLEDKIADIEAALQNLPSGATPQPSSSVDRAVLRELRDKVEELELGNAELKDKVEALELRSGQQPPPPRPTQWQEWKAKACRKIGTVNPNHRSSQTLHCYEPTCGWGNQVTLNGYIQHVKRKHLVKISASPDEKYLPRV